MRLFLLAAAFFYIASAAYADSVTYTLSGTFTGTLGSLSFTDDPGTFTLTSDTAGITDQGGGFYTDTQGTTYFTLDGIGTATILSPTFGAYSASYAAGFYDEANGFGVDDYDPLDQALANYSLTYPLTDTGYLLFGSAGASELTSLGELTITGDYGSSVVFSAEAPSISATPEPSSLVLALTALLGLVDARRRLFKSGNLLHEKTTPTPRSIPSEPRPS